MEVCLGRYATQWILAHLSLFASPNLLSSLLHTWLVGRTQVRKAAAHCAVQILPGRNIHLSSHSDKL